ncbi:MAG: hypothetical protein M0Z33_06055 [Actinomycetota bacterium]|nr:hypothetical protein [Actinomycetota bacterium]
MEFPIGAEVRCADGRCGTLVRVVVDPVARAVTHLVVEPSPHAGAARLVPVDLVDRGGATVVLRCGSEELGLLDPAEETEFVPARGRSLGYRPDEVWNLPYYGLGLGWGPGSGASTADRVEPVVYDRVPPGEVEVRRNEQVHATDGPVGRVQGLVVDPRDHHVTHVLLQEGHLWGRKQVAIPIRSVTSVAAGIRVGLTRDEVRDLPPVEIDLAASP